MPGITDIPVEIFLHTFLQLLPIPDLLNLGATSKFFYITTSDELFWKQKLQEDYNFPVTDTARASGWKFIYKSLSDPQLFVWGENTSGRLGMSPYDLPQDLSNAVPFPIRLTIPGIHITSLVAGGLSFHAIDVKGRVFVWGTLRGQGYNVFGNDRLRFREGFSNPCETARAPMRLELPAAVRHISCARFWSAALDADTNVVTFLSWGRPFVLRTPLLDKSSPSTTPIQVECGWERLVAILTQSGRVLVYWPVRGKMREEIRRVNEALDELGDITKAYVSKDHPQVIPCHVWDMERVEPCQLPDIPEDLPHLAGAGLDRDLLDEETQIIKLAALDHVLIGLTNKGHVLRFNRLEDEATYRHGHWEYLPYFSELDKVSEHPVFSVGRLAPPSKMHITHVSASFETFTAYSTGPESVVLMSRTQTSNLGTQTLMQPHLKPTIIPSLQYRNVISVLLGDYHYGALTATGKLLTWGAFSKGALGLGDPANIDAGQPGGYHVKKQHPTTWRHRRLEDDESTPPDVRDPTEVHFNHGTEHKGKHAHVFAAAAAGWHMGALVIDLQDASERDSL